MGDSKKPKTQAIGKTDQNEGQKSIGSGGAPVMSATIVPGSIVNIAANAMLQEMLIARYTFKICFKLAAASTVDYLI